MNTPQNDDEFQRIINHGMTTSPQPEYTDATPYGIPQQPHKPGLTKRGKAALGIGAAVLAGGSLVGYQIHENNQVKAMELALKTQQLELEKMREMNRASETSAVKVNEQVKARQQSVDACVKDRDDQVGKGFGSPTYREIVDACQDQYEGAPDTTLGVETASSTTSAGGEGGVNDGAILGVAVLGGGLLLLARKGRKQAA